MNFPETQRTGTLAEFDVARLFLSWSWNVGQDQIDIGYDLFVTPSHSLYNGGRFLAQIKGTAKTTGKNSVRAPVSKSRLRQYAESIIPVFIIRVTPEGRFYWLHAQPWTRANEHRLLGSGNISIEFESTQSLDHRSEFECYLKSVLTVTGREAQGEVLLPESLNSRSSINTQQALGFLAESEVSEGFISKLTFTPTQNPENLEKFKDALFFGLPRTFEVEKFNISVPPSLNNPYEEFGKGAISINSIGSTAGKIRLIPGHKHSITTTELSIDAELFNGSLGAAITNEQKASILDICVRFKINKNNSLTPNARFSFRMPHISDMPIKDVDYLSHVHLWAEQALARKSFTLEVEISGQRLPLPFPAEIQESAMEFIHLAHTLGKIHLIARTTGSKLRVPNEFSISRADINNINCAFLLLRGDQQQTLSSLSIELEPSEKIESSKKTSLFGVKIITFNLFDQELCKIPTRFDLIDYQVKRIPNSTKTLVTSGKHGKALMSFADDYSEDLEGAWFSTKKT
ncbi:DUF4365 domain-containing protein [Pseudomonas sp. EA_105y_Pfl2_R69]|uniref:DUF4365 domain-containing protein n=1 Tax=Pseudomonas sp. EA_105y_Pfl2_R69 TaxID=3088683 RepID=UPI0030DA0251